MTVRVFVDARKSRSRMAMRQRMKCAHNYWWAPHSLHFLTRNLYLVLNVAFYRPRNDYIVMVDYIYVNLNGLESGALDLSIGE